MEVVNPNAPSLDELKIVHEIQAETETRIERLREMRHKAVAQSSMDEGSVELF